MVYYFCSKKWNQVITNVLSDTDNTMIPVAECGQEIDFSAVISANQNQLSTVDYIIIDITALTDSEDQIMNTLNKIRMQEAGCRCIIIAPGSRPGDDMLSKCFGMGIYDIVTAVEFQDVYDELKYCIEIGKQYNDVVSFKDSLGSEAYRVAGKAVDHIKIAIGGSQHRIGTTHAVIHLATYLRKKGFIVAVVENTSDYTSFEQIREDSQLKANGTQFSKDGIDYHTILDEDAIAKKAYNFVIFDFGKITESNSKDFLKKEYRFIVAGCKPWEQEYIQDVFAALGDYESISSTYYFFNFCDTHLQSDVKKGMDELANHTLFLPLTDPFECRDPYPGIDDILKDYIPEVVS